MGFFKPKTPAAPPPAPNPPNAAAEPLDIADPLNKTTPWGLSSLISTGSQGLKRRANVQRTSLIGGG